MPPMGKIEQRVAYGRYCSLISGEAVTGSREYSDDDNLGGRHFLVP